MNYFSHNILLIIKYSIFTVVQKEVIWLAVILHFNSYFSFFLHKHFHVSYKYTDVCLYKTFGKFHLLFQDLLLINCISKKFESEHDSFVLHVTSENTFLPFVGERVKTLPAVDLWMLLQAKISLAVFPTTTILFLLNSTFI